MSTAIETLRSRTQVNLNLNFKVKNTDNLNLHFRVKNTDNLI